MIAIRSFLLRTNLIPSALLIHGMSGVFEGGWLRCGLAAWCFLSACAENGGRDLDGCCNLLGFGLKRGWRYRRGRDLKFNELFAGNYIPANTLSGLYIPARFCDFRELKN